jgi:alanine racemase
MNVSVSAALSDRETTRPRTAEDAAAARAGAFLTIDLAALRENYLALRSRLGGRACAAVVKADAYGLGAARIAPVFHEAGCRHFFVAHLDEGLALRQALPDDCAIMVLHGPMPGAEADCAHAGLVPVLNSMEQIEAWGGLARALGRRLPAFVQIDSGMSRMGLPEADITRIAAAPALLDGIIVEAVMSHLACADEPDHPANAEQLANFRRRKALLPDAPASFANSSGIFLGPDYQFDLARPGAALYGLNPQPHLPNPMKNVVRLMAKVVQTREIAAGAHVGYSWRFRADRPTRIATVSVGYADGWLRSLSGRGAVLVDGRAAPIAGRVSMDSITVDVTDLPPEAVKPGSLVELIGPDQSPDAVAALAGTIGYEVLTSLGNRYHRRYLNG